ncbi:No apical meristem-associated, C-terminal domain-containing protein [Phascolomyces articulosus]|uniref:No apical meristem-associated, C-terminal domain-containing protein n=1 Tax=Phascolomyces articulosus TaxID=60185 RepID=A0AAD5PHA1_9FUNG|nr:No apical meristem-associated, C-terminal domain-containing protein [Phascolomyces articulosus]
MFMQFEGKAFSFDHCWEELRIHDKWKDTVKGLASKTKKKGKTIANAPSNVNQEGETGESSTPASTPRPTGVKKEKEKEAIKRNWEQSMKNEAEFLAETKKKTKYLEELMLIEKEKRKEVRRKLDYEIIYKDTSDMDDITLQFHTMEKKKNILEKNDGGKRNRRR